MSRYKTKWTVAEGRVVERGNAHRGPRHRCEPMCGNDRQLGEQWRESRGRSAKREDQSGIIHRDRGVELGELRAARKSRGRIPGRQISECGIVRCGAHAIMPGEGTCERQRQDASAVAPTPSAREISLRLKERVVAH